MYTVSIWRRCIGRLGIEMPVALEQSQDSYGECFVLPVFALEPMLVERTCKEGVGKMQWLFGNVFERTSADDNDVVFRHAAEGLIEKMNGCLLEKSRWCVDQAARYYFSSVATCNKAG